jgi:Ca2+-binding RTX toxin-like protein
MASITYANGISVFPAAGDLADLYTNLIPTGASSSQFVLENAFARITINASGTSPFTYVPGAETPSGGTVASIKVEVFSAAATVVELLSATYPSGSEIQVSFLVSNYGLLSFRPEQVFSQADSITGSASADWIIGYGSNDTLSGAAGDDTLDGGGNTDSMTGGAGDDAYIVENSADIVVEAADSGLDTVAVVAGLTYTLPQNVENGEIAPGWAFGGWSYSGSNITGNTAANILRGNQSRDTLSGGNGNDRLYGNGESDTLDGGTGGDTMSGGDGDDTYFVDNAGDRVLESASNVGSYGNGVSVDLVNTTINFTLSANVENLKLLGTGNLSGTGNALDNRIVANAGNNAINGSDGVDTLSYEGTTASLTVALNTTAAQATGGSGSDTVRNIENLVGGSGKDNFKGNPDANRLDGAGGADTLAGFAGDDTYVVDNSNDRVAEAAGNGTDLVESSIDWTLGDNLENLTLTAFGSLKGTGNALANVIQGERGNDSLSGLEGADTLYGGIPNVVDGANDTLNGGKGADSMSGGSGNDTYYVDDPGDIVTDVPDYPTYRETNVVVSSINYALPDYIDNLELVGGAIRGAGNILDNVITANAKDNILNGGRGIDTVSYATATAGVTVSLATNAAQATRGSGSDAIRNFENITGSRFNDTLAGNAGDNVLDGGVGSDSMIGGRGNDIYIIDAAADVITEAAGNGTDLVKSSVSLTLGANIENLELTGGGLINGTGTGVANSLVGNDGNNQLFGLAGNDTLRGGGGTDTLNGGAGDDLYLIDSRSDVMSDSDGTDTVRMDLRMYNGEAPYELADGIENFEAFIPESFYASSYFSNARGNALANQMTGAADRNALEGGAGADTLNGGMAEDTLTGGAGADVFVFDTPLASYNQYQQWLGNGIDSITDFQPGTDRLRLDDDVFPALPSGVGGALLAGNFKSGAGASASDADDRIIYDTSTGALYYDPDGNGLQQQVQFALFVNKPPGLAATDFEIG